MFKDLIKLKPSNQTLFTVREIAQILNINNKESLYSFLKNSSANNDLTRVTRGIYSLSNNFSKFELGNKLRQPSYISLYSILQKEGVTFQNYDTIFLISNRAETINLEKQVYMYKKIKDNILFNPLGIKTENATAVATAERAICDLIYLGFDYYLDNLRQIDFTIIKELNSILYKSKKIEDFINQNKKLCN